MAKRLNDKAYRGHIVAAGKRIERYIKKKTLAQFRKDDMLQAAVVREIEIIGEASRNLSAAFRKIRPDIPWRQVIGMRNVVIHDYFLIDIPDVWVTATKDVPRLLEQLREKK